MFDQIDRPDAEYRLSVLAGRLEGSQPPALRALVAAAAYDWSRYQRERSAHIRHGTGAPREALVRLASESLGDAAQIAHGIRGSAAGGQLEHYQEIGIDALIAELARIDEQIVNERQAPRRP